MKFKIDSFVSLIKAYNSKADSFVNLGLAQSVVWDAMVPSKKRTHVGRPKPLYVEKLMRDLCTILHEQQSYFSASSEEDLLFESDTPMVSVEIGHGSILIRHPSSIARDEEFEASTLSVDNKQCLMNEAYSFSSTIPMYSDCNNMNFSSHRVEKIKNLVGQIMQQEKLERHVFPDQFTIFHYSSQLRRSIDIIKKKFHFVYSWLKIDKFFY